MFTKKFFSLIGLVFLGNRILVSAEDCNVLSPSNCIRNTYYLVDKTDYSLVKKDAEGSLYYCKGDPVSCTEIIVPGYYIVDKKTVYTCRDQSGEVLCIKTEVTETACDDVDKIGKLFAATDTVSLCLNYDPEADPGKKASTVEINGTTSGNYLISKNTDSAINIFGITRTNEKYAVITLKEKVITLNANYENGLRYAYAIKESRKVMQRGDGTYPKNASGAPDTNNILEVSCTRGRCKDVESEIVYSITGAIEGINIFKLAEGVPGALAITDFTTGFDDAKANLRLFSCDDSENCVMISGYALKNDGVNDVYFKITKEGASAIETDNKDCTSENIGEVFTADGTNFSICLDNQEKISLIAGNVGKYILGSGKAVGAFEGQANKVIEIGEDANFVFLSSISDVENGKDYIVKLGASNHRVYKYNKDNDEFTWDTTLYGVKNYLIDSSNIISEYTIADTKPITEAAHVASWKLFNCMDGKCKQTYGYMKSPNEDEKFIMFPDATAVAANAILTTDAHSFVENCQNADNTFKLIKDGTLCIVGHGTAGNERTGKMEDGNVFLITTTNSAKDIFTKADGKNLIVEVSGNYIYYNNFYRDKGPNLFRDSIKVPTSAINSSEFTKFALYDCGEDECVASGGYAINSNGYYAILDTPTTSAYEIEEAGGCTGNIGEILTIGSTNYLCLAANKMGEVKNGFYFLKTDTESSKPLKGYVSKIIRISDNFISIDHSLDASSNTNYIIKNGNTYKHYTYTSGTPTFAEGSANGVFIYEHLIDNVYKIVTDAESVEITDPTKIQNWVLFDCASGDCQPTYGYYTVGADAALKYFTIPYSGSNSIQTVTTIGENKCKVETDIGNLVVDAGDNDKIKLCVVNHSSNPILMEFDEADYIISSENESVFAGASSDKSIIIHGPSAKKSLTLKHVDDFNVLKVDGYVVTPIAQDECDTAKDKVRIFHCVDDACEKVPGYVLDNSKYYAIDTTGDATDVTPAGNVDNCSASSGKIDQIESAKYLCIDTTNYVTFSPSYYPLGTAVTGSKLTTNKMIKVTSTYAVVYDTIEPDVDTNYLVKIGAKYIAYKYTLSTGKFTTESTASGIRTYQKIDSEATTNLYKEVTDLSTITLLDLNDLSLFHCSSGECSLISGDILISGNRLYTCSAAGDCTTAEANIVDSCSSGSEGKFKVVKSTIKLCTKTGTETFGFIDIVGTSKFWIDVNKPMVYKRNSAKTIITIEAAVAGAYLVNDNNEIVTSEPTGLIVCESDSSCEAKSFDEAGIGYYKDSTDSDKFIKCTGESCVSEGKDGETCASANNNIGKIDSTGSLCLEDGKTGSFTEAKYLVNFESDSNFPLSETKANDKYIYVQATDISITVFTLGTETDICGDDDYKYVADKGANCESGKTNYHCATTSLCDKGTKES